MKNAIGAFIISIIDIIRKMGHLYQLLNRLNILSSF